MKQKPCPKCGEQSVAVANGAPMCFNCALEERNPKARMEAMTGIMTGMKKAKNNRGKVVVVIG